MLLHIALDITTHDLEHFYVGILGGTIVKQFELNEDISAAVFQVPKATQVAIVAIQDVHFELFLHNSTLPSPTYRHLCFEMHNAVEINQKALAAHYSVYEREGFQGTTYFIKDGNENIFEIKSTPKA